MALASRMEQDRQKRIWVGMKWQDRLRFIDYDLHALSDGICVDMSCLHMYGSVPNAVGNVAEGKSALQEGPNKAIRPNTRSPQNCKIV